MIARHGGNPGHNVFQIRTTLMTLSRAMAMLFGITAAAPLRSQEHGGDVPVADGGALWVLYVASMVLVLMGGAFAGLTIALMGQDEVYLQVVSLDPEEPQRKNARRVHDLLTKGKHWLLVTLLLSNVIVNETLPVVLDRCFGGGVAAVVGSTVLIGTCIVLHPLIFLSRPALICILSVVSYLRRSSPPVGLRPLRPANRRLYVQARAFPYVRHGSGCLAYC